MGCIRQTFLLLTDVKLVKALLVFVQHQDISRLLMDTVVPKSNGGCYPMASRIVIYLPYFT